MPQTKILPISLPQICAPREELLRVFEQCAQKQYLYIHAPAGYGKTITTLLWLKKTKRSFAWLFLDKYDNILSLFYRSLCRSILTAAQSVRPSSPESQRNDALANFISSPDFSTSPVENAMEFISMLTWREGQYALILDDLHNITDGEILKSLPYVLKRLPAFVNILFLSRTALPDVMRVMTENERTGFIGSNALKFTPEEIRKHFISYGWFLSMERAADVHTYTDGWVIILNAMVLNGDNKLSYENHNPSLDEFFENNIWNGFDDATKGFLMKTSIVDSFTLELCESLTRRSDSAGILDMLIRGNINLSRMGNEYRYHNLFLEFLRERLQKSGIDQEELFNAATVYYMETEKYYMAVVCSLRGSDKTIESQGIGNFFKSKNPTLEQFYELARAYDVLSKEQCDKYPIRYMPNILTAFLTGDTDGVKRLFDNFYAALPIYREYKHQIGEVAVTRLLLDFRVKLPELPAFIDSLNLKIVNAVQGQSAIATLQMPFLHRSIRDLYEFLNPDVRNTVHGLFSCLLPGDSECFYQGVTAGLLMEQNKLAEAFEKASATYDSMKESTSISVCFGVSILLSELYSFKSDKERSREILQRLRNWIDDNRALYLLKNLTAYEERLKIWDYDRTAAAGWLDNYFINENASGEFHKIYQNFTTARAYIVLSDNLKALAVLSRIYKLGSDMNRPFDMAEANVLTSVIEWISGKKKEARERLYSVIATMQPYHFIRIIANEGKAVLPILTAVLKKLDKEDDKNETLYRFTKEVQLAAYEQSKRYNGITYGIQLAAVKLSPKQAQVLDLLSKGYKNAEIIELTGMSINTVREHTKVAYKKLEVTNAMDAIIKAKQLGILK